MASTYYLFTLFLVWASSARALREIPYLTLDSKRPGEEEEYEYKIVMPEVTTSEVNKYVCYSKSLDELGESYVTGMYTEYNMEVAPHHVDAGLCLDPVHKDASWLCNRGVACRGDSVEFSVTDNFSSVRNPLYTLPKGVSSRINHGKETHYLIVQMHIYEPLTTPGSPANVTLTFQKKPTQYSYQKFMLANDGEMPANKPHGFFSHVGCEWRRPKAIAFDYYVHTHTRGVFVEGFLIRNDTWRYLGGQKTIDRHRMQFDILNGPVEILPGDVLASRCLFINNENKAVNLGSEDTCIFQMGIAYEPHHQEYYTRPPACMSKSPDFTFCANDKTAALCDH